MPRSRIWKKKEKDFYNESPARVINLACIRQIIPENVFDKSIELTRLQISDDHTDDILVSKEEGEKIKKTLLGRGGQEKKTSQRNSKSLTACYATSRKTYRRGSIDGTRRNSSKK